MQLNELTNVSLSFQLLVFLRYMIIGDLKKNFLL